MHVDTDASHIPLQRNCRYSTESPYHPTHALASVTTPSLARLIAQPTKNPDRPSLVASAVLDQLLLLREQRKGHSGPVVRPPAPHRHTVLRQHHWFPGVTPPAVPAPLAHTTLTAAANPLHPPLQLPDPRIVSLLPVLARSLELTAAAVPEGALQPDSAQTVLSALLGARALQPIGPHLYACGHSTACISIFLSMWSRDDDEMTDARNSLSPILQTK